MTRSNVSWPQTGCTLSFYSARKVMHSCFYGAFFFFLALAINQSSCVHKPAVVILQEARREEKRFLLNPELRLDTGFVYCRCVFPAAFPTEDLKHACVCATLAFSSGSSFMQRYGRWRIRCCVFTAAGFDCEQQHMLLAGVNISFEHIWYKLLHLTCASSVCISLLPHTQKNVCSCLYLSFYSCVS